MDKDIIFFLEFVMFFAGITSIARAYRTYIAPFSTLSQGLDFWRLRRCLIGAYSKTNPDQLSMDYRKKHQLNNVELTYGEIILKSLHEILQVANAKPHEKFVDLGSGTGKVACSACVLFNFREVIGIEIQDALYDFSNSLLTKLKSSNPRSQHWQDKLKRVTFLKQNFLDSNLDDADIIFANATCFSTDTWRQLEEKFKRCKPGTRYIMTTKYLKDPAFKLLHSVCYPMSWGYARLSVYERLSDNTCS